MRSSVRSDEIILEFEQNRTEAGMLIGSSSHQSFTANAVAPLINIHNNHKPSSINPPLYFWRNSSEDSSSEDCSRRYENKVGKLAIVTLAAGLLSLGTVGDASAVKSGGRVGGQAFRSAPPRSSSPPRINNNSRTNIYVNPPVAPPLVGGYGYGYGGVPFYGGWSPFSFFTPGPTVAIGFGGGFDTLVLFMVFGAVTAVVRRFLGSRDDTDDDY